MENDVVILKLDEDRELKYTIKSIKRLQKIFGCSTTKILKKLEDIDINEVIKIAYEGIKHEADNLKLDDFEDLVDTHSSVGALIEAVTLALTSAFSIDEKKLKAVQEKTGL